MVVQDSGWTKELVLGILNRRQEGIEMSLTELIHKTDETDTRLIADDLLAALAGILAVANVRIDDPRCKVFDEARAAVARAKRQL